MNEEQAERSQPPTRDFRAPQSARRSDTRRQLILAAERLFAERGIEGVSLREINLAANQRNTSAAHYHFGSKEALIDAIFEFRRAEMGDRRDALLDAMEASGQVDARSIAQVWIEPLSSGVQNGPDSGRYYVEFLAQLLVTAPELAGEVLSKHHQAASDRLHRMTTQGVPHVPSHVLLTRSGQMARHAVISMAGYLRGGAGHANVGFDGFVSDLIDATAGYLSAPVSARTQGLYLDRSSCAGGSTEQDD